MYIVKIDGEEIKVSLEDLAQLDISMDQHARHILSQDKAYKAHRLATNAESKEGSLSIDNYRFSFVIQDQYDQLVSSMGLDTIASNKVTDIIAPMPGLILDIMVKAGDEVEEGQSILILEAMKMENVIKAEGAGTVKSINKDVGATVEKGTIIVEMESA